MVLKRVHQVHSLEVIDHKSSKGPGSWDRHKKQGLASMQMGIFHPQTATKGGCQRGEKAGQKPWKLDFIYLGIFTYVCAVKVTLG